MGILGRQAVDATRDYYITKLDVGLIARSGTHQEDGAGFTVLIDVDAARCQIWVIQPAHRQYSD
jgi:hypothetical protein